MNKKIIDVLFRKASANIRTINVRAKPQIIKAIYTAIVDEDAAKSLEAETMLKLERVTYDFRYNNPDAYINEVKPLYEKWQIQQRRYAVLEQTRLNFKRMQLKRTGSSALLVSNFRRKRA